MTAGPRKICRDLPNIGAFSVHDEDLLASAVNELVEQGQIEKVFREYNVSWIKP